jgi:hypothetical protein
MSMATIQDVEMGGQSRPQTDAKRNGGATETNAEYQTPAYRNEDSITWEKESGLTSEGQ